jgi:hypothetical protein
VTSESLAPPMIGVDDIDDSLDSAASSLSVDANDKNTQQNKKKSSTEPLRIKSAPSSGGASSLFSPRPVIVNLKHQKDICNTIEFILITLFFEFSDR